MIVLFFSCSDVGSDEELGIEAVSGVLDLRGYNWKEKGPVDLKGEWKFIANGEEADILVAAFDDSAWGDFIIPNHWHGLFGDSKGYYYFRLKVLLDNPGEMAVFLKKAYTAYHFYINEELVISNGLAGNDRDSTVPQQLPSIGPFADSDELDILLKVSNFHDVFGGLQDAPRLGLYDNLITEKYYIDFFHLLMMGILFIAGIYHFLFWVRRRQDKSNLFFSLCCIFIAAYLSSFNAYIAQLFPQIKAGIFHLSVKTDYISIFLYSLVAPRFFRLFFPEEFSKTILRLFNILASVLILFVLFAETAVFSKFLYPFVALHFFLFSWILLSLVRATLHKRKYAVLYMISYIILFLAVSSDILRECNVYSAVVLSPPGLTLAIMLQSFTLTDVFIQALKRSRYLEKNLFFEVDKQTALLNSRNSQLDSILSELKMSEQYKNNFFQNISHELRTPLTLILDPVQALKEKHLELFPEETKAVFGRIDVDALKLRQNIEQLMDLTRIEIGKDFLNLEQVDIERLFWNIGDLFHQEDVADRLVIEGGEKIPQDLFYLDAVKINRVFQHLISNALLYSQGSVYVNISVVSPNSDKLEESSLHVSVRDSGPGIPEDRLPYLFEKPTEKKGFGIGLYLVKKYISMHKGDIKVLSSAQGTEFLVSIPLLEKEFSLSGQDMILSYSEVNAETEESSDFLKKTILLVEHNPQLKAYLLDQLSSFYRVLDSGNGREALVLYKANKVDMVLCETDMPEMDGFQLRKIVQKQNAGNCAPFLFLAPVNSAKTWGQNKSSEGVIDYIEKPFNIEVLVKRIQALFNLQSIQKTQQLKKIEEEISGLIWGKDEEIGQDFFRTCDRFGVSEREREIIRKVLDAKSNNEISEQLGISVTTVKNHISSVFFKFDVNSRGELIACFRDEAL